MHLTHTLRGCEATESRELCTNGGHLVTFRVSHHQSCVLLRDFSAKTCRSRHLTGRELTTGARFVTPNFLTELLGQRAQFG